MIRNVKIGAAWKTVLWLCIYFGIFARFYNLNWSQDSLLLHPDEERIVHAADSIVFFSNLDTKFYAYNGFTMYLLAGVKSLLHTFIPWLPITLPRLLLIGRILSSSASTATIFLVYHFAKYLLKRTDIALLGAAIFSLSVGSIQTAHFYTTESFLVLFSIVYTFAALKYFTTGKRINIVVAGVFLGLAAGTKTTGILLTPILVSFIGIRMFKHRNLLRSLIDAFVAGVAALVVFLLSDLFLFTAWTSFVHETSYTRRLISGIERFPWTTQFNDAGLGLIVKNIFVVLGPVVPLFSLIGLAVLIYHAVGQKKWGESIVWFWSLGFFLYLATLFLKFYRYLMPLAPFAAIAAAYALYRIRQKSIVAGSLLTAVTLLGTALWTVAFFSIYTSQHTNVRASEYLLATVKPEERMVKETWNEALPLQDIYNFALFHQTDDIDMFALDNPGNAAYFATLLSNATYIVLSSQKNYLAITHHTDWLPVAVRYYEALFSGKLGFVLEKTFESQPRIGPFAFDDTVLEETFWVFDHPTVYIFKKTQQLPAEQISTIISPL